MVKKSTPAISVIVPMYNVEGYLCRCLDSLLNQTFPNFEIVCVDDGSPDNSGKIAEEYAGRDNRVIVIHKENAGVSDARNTGIEYARGKYIMFVDPDDCVHRQTLEIAYNFAIKNDVDLVSWRIDKSLYKEILDGNNVNESIQKRQNVVYDLKKIKFKKTNNLINYATERNHSLGKWRVRHCYPVVHLFERDLVKDIRFQKHIKISEDFPFWTAVLLRVHSSVILKTPLYFYLPNMSSALRGANNEGLVENVTLAIISAFGDVMSYGVDSNWVCKWRREFLWPFIIIFVRELSQVKDQVFLKKIYTRLCEMRDMGIFDERCGVRVKKYGRKIEKFISQFS